MKSLLIAKSNLKKFKGLSICISLLIFISAMFITVICLLQTDFKSNTRRNSNKLNTSDVILFGEKGSTYTKDEFKELLPSSANLDEYEFENVLLLNIKCKFGKTSNILDFYVEKEDAFKRNISEVEIIEEKKSINENYIYLPYQFKVGGNVKLGQNYTLKFNDYEHTYKVKGFINSTYGGCMNMGIMEIVVPDLVYEEMKTVASDNESFVAYVNFNKISDIDKMMSEYVANFRIEHNEELQYVSENDIVSSRAFMGDIFFVIFFMVIIIIIFITMLSIYNNISNYLKENMKTLGILKAIGYKSNDIRLAIVLQFSILMAIGVFLGIIGGYLFMPLISGVLVAQSGLPYTVSFNFISTIAPIIIVPIFIYLIIFLTLIRVKKIDAVSALKDTGGSHVFKYNPVKLDKAKGNVNILIALKNTFNSLKQNIINFVVIVFLSILLVTAVTFYENFDRHLNVDLVVGEYSDIFLGVNEGYSDEMKEILEADPRTKNVRLVDSMYLMDENYIRLNVLAEDDMTKYRNKKYVYKGKLPINDNEVCVSGSYAKKYGYKIGDEIELSGFKKFSYLITGFVQSTNNGGREAIMSIEALDHVAPDRKQSQTFYLEIQKGSNEAFKNDYENNPLYKDMIAEIITFDEALESSAGVFKTLSKSLVLIIFVLSFADICLVMYMLLKSLIHKRRYEYGIMKALGFTSRQLIIQNVISFMPLIIIGSIIGSILGYLTMPSFFTIGMQSFGIMQSHLLMPIDLIILSVLFIIIVSFVSVVLMSRRIKKIEPYKLLIEE